MMDHAFLQTKFNRLLPDHFGQSFRRKITSKSQILLENFTLVTYDNDQASVEEVESSIVVCGETEANGFVQNYVVSVPLYIEGKPRRYRHVLPVHYWKCEINHNDGNETHQEKPPKHFETFEVFRNGGALVCAVVVKKRWSDDFSDFLVLSPLQLER